MRIRLVAAVAAAAIAAGAGGAVAADPLPDVSGVTCPIGAFPVVDTNPGDLPTLGSAAAARGVTFGTAVDLDALRTEQAYRDTLAREFALVVPENEMKMRHTRPAREVFDFCEADQIAAFARMNGLKVRGAPLVWHQNLPTWLTSRTWTRDELTEILRTHVMTTVTHFRGVVTQWDVVNEPVSNDGGSMRRTLWREGLGPDYVAQALLWAHEADPDAQLFVNEYGAEQDPRRLATLYSLVRSLKLRGIPIHGVGLQGHVSGTGPSGPALRAVMAKFTALGLKVAVTEADVGADPSRLAHDREGAFAAQATGWRNLLDGCLTTAACGTFVSWGFTDAHSWRASEAPLPFDHEYVAKPAYAAMMARLRK